ncbi:MAG: hypothetical protein IIC01_03855 [Planctomycetes bacterium]|nr:hypothetical protein [Planctomycetota bacterium]
MRIQQYEDMLGLPCLGGEDVDRYPDRLWVTIDGDRLRHAETGELLSVESDGETKGWGHLDGPSCRVTDDGGRSIDMPKAVIDQLGIAVDTEA